MGLLGKRGGGVWLRSPLQVGGAWWIWGLKHSREFRYRGWVGVYGPGLYVERRCKETFGLGEVLICIYHSSG